MSQLNDKLTRLDNVAGQLSAELDPAAAVCVTDSKRTLDCCADKLQSRLQQLCAQLESTMDEHAKFVEKCRVIDTFLKTLSTDSNRPSTVSIPLVQQSISVVKEEREKINKMEPELAILNELGQALSLADDDVSKLAELNDRWDASRRGKDEELRQLEQRLEQLDAFSEQCHQWTEFVDNAAAELHQLPTVCSYDSLLQQQHKIEVA